MISSMLETVPVPFDNRDRQFAWIVAAASFLILLPGAFWGLPFGKTMVGGMLVAEGASPYLDFWTMYAPGMYWLTGAIFRLFGPEVLYQAIAACLVSAGNTAMLYLLARRIDAPRPLALVVAGATLVGCWTTAPKLYSYPLALFLLLWALAFVVRYHREGGVSRLFPAGLCIGLAALTFVLQMLLYASPDRFLLLLRVVSLMLFLCAVTGAVLYKVLHGGRVTTHRIRGAIAVYLMLGLIWASAYSLILICDPASFDLGRSIGGTVDLEGIQTTGMSRLIYFSFVTMTTLGYGDITPQSDAADSLVILQALTGQIYLVVILARLVSLAVVNADRE
jgi:hypothetical protein